MLAAVYYGAMYGGTITSVLINTPGESATVASTFDGYPLAKQGRAGAGARRWPPSPRSSPAPSARS